MKECISTVKNNYRIKAGLVLLFIFLFLFSFLFNPASASGRMFGNIDGEEDINVNDVVLVMQYVLGMKTPDDDQREAADVNNDGKVNIIDVVLIMQYVLDLIDEFPAELVTADTFITVNPIFNSIAGHNWSSEETVRVTVNGEEFIVDTDEDGNFNLCWSEYPGLEIKVGQTVIATDGDIKKIHIVRDLALTAIDSEADTVLGTAPAGSTIEVRVFDTELDYGDMPLRTVVVGVDGKWTADFSVAGGTDLAGSTFDIVDGVTGEARITDLTGDVTMFYWHYEEAAFVVYVEEDKIIGFGWAPNSDITITVGDDQYELNTDVHGYFNADIEVSSGDSVQVTDGITTKEHVVTALQVNDVDRDTGLIIGTADQGTVVFVILLEPADGDRPPSLIDEAEVEADINGEWSIDFDGEINEIITIYIMQIDDDGDRTVVVR